MKTNNPKLKLDLKKLANSELALSLARHLDGYEKRVKEFVKEFDVKSRDARTKGQKQLDKFAGQLKRTRTDLEKRVATLFHEESRQLNQRVNELVNYLKRVTKSEKLKPESSSSKKKETAKAQSSDSPKTVKKTTARKTKAKKSTAEIGASA
jgi:hypothetical protein